MTDSPRTLIPLDEWNRARSRAEWARQEAAKNGEALTGIACPRCECFELVNTTPGMILASFPPKINVRCINDEECGFSGYALA